VIFPVMLWYGSMPLFGWRGLDRMFRVLWLGSCGSGVYCGISFKKHALKTQFQIAR